MTRMLLIVCILLSCSKAHAGWITKVFKEASENVSNSVRKGDSDIPVSKKSDMETLAPKVVGEDVLSTGSKTLDDLDLNYSTTFRLGEDDFVRGSEKLKDSFSFYKPSKSSIDFKYWMNYQLASSPFRAWARNYTEEPIPEASGIQEEPIFQKNLTIDELHLAAQKELKSIGDPDEYMGQLWSYFEILPAYGWSGFNPWAFLDRDSYDSWPPAFRLATKILWIAILDAMQEDTQEIKSHVEKGVEFYQKSLALEDFYYYLLLCTAFGTGAPGMAGDLWLSTEVIYNKYCNGPMVDSGYSNFLGKAKSFDDGSLISLKASIVTLLSSDGLNARYLKYRDEILETIPLIADEEEGSELSFVFTMLAYSELVAGNPENAYQISIYTLHRYKDDIEVRNQILGWVLPAIYAEVKDVRMLHKLLKPIRAMAQDTSKFNIKVESKVNLISVLSVYEYLLKKQSK